MHIELTEQERLLVQQGKPVDVTDPQTNEAYILIAKQRFEQVRSRLLENGAPKKPDPPEQEIPEGIRISQEAYRRDLPELLKQKRFYRKWIAYHRHERLGIANSQRTLLIECYKRGLARDEFFVGWIHEYGLLEEEEVEPRPEHFVEDEDEGS